MPGTAARLGLTLALLLGLVSACSSTQPTAPSTSAVRALLGHYAAAVRTGDLAAATADLDSGSAAAAFRSQQLSALQALHQLPLRGWTYIVAAPVTDAGATAAAARRYGAPATIARVDLRYQLVGVDAVPVQRQLWWTFVRRDGRTRLAGDDDLAANGGVSWHGPWDFGPVAVQRSAAGIVVAAPAAAGQLSALSATAATAVAAVSRVWGTGWTRQLAVVVPADEAEAQALGASAGGGTDVAAATTGGQRDPSSGRVSGVFVVVQPAVFGRLDAPTRQRVLTHEATHVASADATGDSTPRWLVEGLAEYVSRLGEDEPVATAAPELAAAVRAGRLPSALPSDAAFDPADAGVLAAYQQAWLAVRLVGQRSGPAGVVTLYQDVGRSPLDAESAVAAGLAAVLHESTAAFGTQWRADLQAELG